MALDSQKTLNKDLFTLSRRDELINNLWSFSVSKRIFPFFHINNSRTLKNVTKKMWKIFNFLFHFKGVRHSIL